MSHQIESMMFVGEKPWHNLGTELPLHVSAVESLQPAGLDWAVELKSVYAQLTNIEYAQAEGFRAVVRTSDNSVLGVVGDRYSPLQNKEVAEMADIIAGEGKARVETAGSLDNGKKVWFLVLLPGEIIVKKDISEIQKYLLLTSSHDGSGTYRLLFTPTRVVCANTLKFALQGKNDEGISIRHTKHAHIKMETAKNSINRALDFYSRFEILANVMVETPFNDNQMDQLVEDLFPCKDNEMATRTKNNRDKLASLFNLGAGHEHIAGTAWGALNAVVEFVDHHRGTRVTEGKNESEQKLNSIWFGSGSLFKQAAFDKICGMACL